MASFNLFNFDSIPGTSVQKIGTGATLPQSGMQTPTQSVQPVQNTMRFFKDEEEANTKMLNAGLSQEQANELHKKRRNDLIGKISQQDGEALIKMRDAGLRADEAAKLVKEKREATPDTRPLWKKAGEGTVNFLAGNLDTVLKYGGNILDVATFGQTGIGEEVKGMTEQNKELFKGSTAFKAGTYLPDVAIATAPLGKAVQSMSALKGGALVGAGFGAAQPLLEKGSEATMGDVALGGVVGGTVGAVAGPVIGKAIQKGAKYGTALYKGGLEGVGKSISRDASKFTLPGTSTVTRAIPKKIVSGDLGFTPTERAKIENITGKDEATYVLEKGLAGKEKEELAGVFMKQSDDMYNGITQKLAKVDKRVQSNTAKEALGDIIDQLESSKKLRTAYAKDIEGAKAMLEKGDYSLSDLNNIRRAYDKVNVGMYSTQGTVKSGVENAVDVKIRESLSSQLQKEAKLAGVDVKAMNNELRAGLVMKDALLRRLSQEERNNFIGLQDLGVSAILSGGNPAVALGTVVAKKYAEKIAPSVSQKLYNLNKTPNVPRTVSRGNTISPRNKSSILNLTANPVTPVASKQVVKEVKKPLLLGPATGKAAIPLVKAGKLESTSKAISGKVGERPGTVKPISSIPEAKSKIEVPAKKMTERERMREFNRIANETNGSKEAKIIDAKNKEIISKFESKINNQLNNPKKVGTNFEKDFNEAFPLGKETGTKTSKNIFNSIESKKDLELRKELVEGLNKSEPKFTREQATKYMDENIDKIMKEVKKGKLTNEEGKTQMLELKNDMKYLRMGITPERLKEGKKTILNGVIKELEKSNPIKNGQVNKKSTTPEVQGTSGEIPEGYIRNPFNGKIEKINQSKKGSLNIGQIGKDLGLIKKEKSIEPLIEEAKKHKSAEEFINAQGEPIYHGTNRNFDNFDIEKSYGARNEKFGGGKALYFSPDEVTARAYSNANSLSSFNSSILSELKKENVKLGDLAEILYKNGFDNGWDIFYKKNNLNGWNDMEKLIGPKYDLNRLWDIIENTRGAKIAVTKDGLSEIMGALRGKSSGDLPDWLIKSAEKMGIKDIPRDPRVIKVYTNGNIKDLGKTNIKDLPSLIASAKSKGYDGVKFTTSESVYGTPEIAIFNPSKIKTEAQLKDIYNKANKK